MKKRTSILSLSLLAAGFLSGTGALAADAPVETLLPAKHIYAPKGFDTNDNTQVVISGQLPNLCYKAPRAEAKVVGKTISIRLTALKQTDPRFVCPQVIVPFLETVSVGVLDKGDYKVEVNANTPHQSADSIQVVESTSAAVDDYVYARVNYVQQAPGTRVVTLVGYNPSDCYVLEEIKFVSNEKDTFAVLPIMRKVSDLCPMKMVPFAYDAFVPEGLAPQDILLHVRVMDGKSVNTLFENR